MKSLDEVIEDMDLGCLVNRDYNDKFGDVLQYLKEYQAVTKVCHKHGIGSIWGFTLPDPDQVEGRPDVNGCMNMPLSWEELIRMEGQPVYLEQYWYKLQDDLTKEVQVDSYWAVVDNVQDKRVHVVGRRLSVGIRKVDLNSDKPFGWKAYRKEKLNYADAG